MTQAFQNLSVFEKTLAFFRNTNSSYSKPFPVPSFRTASENLTLTAAC